MLLAEDLLLLLTEDQTGKHLIDRTALDLGLAGACLIDLAGQGRVEIAGDNDTVKRGRVVIRDATPTGDDVLDDVLARLAKKEGKKPATALQSLTKGIRATLLDRLCAKGLVRHEEGRVLAIFPVSRWPAADLAHEAQVRASIERALLQDLSPDPRTASLIALLSAVDAPHKVVNGSVAEVSNRTIKARAKAVREGHWAADAVSAAIQAIQSAITAAIIASTVTASAGASGS